MLSAGLALTYAFGIHSWSQSIIPETYTLNALLFFLMFALILPHAKALIEADRNCTAVLG